ncbi:MAG: NUDIX domain-containing protein [Candidatus Izemoplasmatales bacterium]
MELWDAYDIDFNLLVGAIERDRPIPTGWYHLVVEVLTLTPDGKMLLTRRDPRKTFPLKWEITGGSALQGEDAVTAAVRELGEETGLVVRRDDLRLVASFAMLGNTHFRTFVAVREVRSEDIRLQDGETVDWKLVTPEVFTEMCRTGDVAAPIAKRLDEYLGFVADAMGVRRS